MIEFCVRSCGLKIPKITSIVVNRVQDALGALWIGHNDSRHPPRPPEVAGDGLLVHRSPPALRLGYTLTCVLVGFKEQAGIGMEVQGGWNEIGPSCTPTSI